MAITLRSFGATDFERLISWLPTPEALAQWCAAFFAFPLDHAQLARYLESATQPLAREIFVAVDASGEAVGHVEISRIWPHLSCRLSRVLVAPPLRRQGLGRTLAAAAADHAFAKHRVDRIDLGVGADNAAAIACYRSLGFRPVGLWPAAIAVGGGSIDVCWMTLFRSAWSRDPDRVGGPG